MTTDHTSIQTAVEADTDWWFIWAATITVLAWIVFYAFPVPWWAYENGPIEWIGTLLFGAAAVTFGMAARRHSDRAHKVMSWFLCGLFVLSFLEELSWGQQVFKWSTPPALGSNTQNETNLHNMSLGVDLQRLFTLGIVSLAVLVPLINRFWGWGRNAIQRLGIPVVSLVVSAWVILMLAIDTVFGAGEFDPERTRLGREYVEMLWALTAFLVATAALRESKEHQITSS